MTIARFIAQLNSLGVQVWLEGEQLRYQAPKGVLTPELRAEMLARKAELLEFLRQAQQTPATAIQPALRPEQLPLSFMQEPLWFLGQLEGSSATYNTPSRIRLTGALNVAALAGSLQEIDRRHETLRARFPKLDGKPYQQIGPPNFTMAHINLASAPPTEQATTLQQLIDAEASRPFDLTTGPLWRATLVRLGDENHVLVLTFHHIGFDGWSMGVFNHELGLLYASYCQGQPALLPELPIQYADFVLWQRGWWVEQMQSKRLAYWQAQLAGAPTYLPLPTDYPRPPMQRFRGANFAFDVPGELMDQLQRLSQQQGVTLFMLLEAALAVLLYRYTGETDILIGTAVANRERAELAALIGYFANILVLRNDLSTPVGGEPLTFTQFLARVSRMAQDAYRYQDTPFELLVDALKLERTLSHNPLIQVAFSLEGRTREQTLTLPGLDVAFLAADVPVAKNDLALMLYESPAGYTGNWEYSVDLFAPTTIERMTVQWLTLLTGIAVNPDQALNELPLLTAAERQQILVEWNATKDASAQPTHEKCFHQLFEEQVDRTPDAVAVVYEDLRFLIDDLRDQGTQADGSVVQVFREEPTSSSHQSIVNQKSKSVNQLTYRELNERANQLARHLQTRGVGPETLVGLCVERSPAMIIALLAILKVGGAYVPLDPAYPADRLAFMLADSQVELIVTQEKFVALLPADKALFVCLDTLRLTDYPTNNLDVAVQPDHLAYMIYTSGSTGKPKGVLIEQRGLSNTAEAQVQAFGLGPQDRHLLFFSLSFDGCTADITLALRVGAALYLAPQQEILPGEPLRQFLQRHAITSLILTPSALAQVPATDLPALRTVIVAGETCSADLVARWIPNRKFMNLYGATEASIFSTVAVCTGDGSTPSVGRPVINNQLYILDSHLQPVPVGLTGEIYIGGIGVARGYHNRPELNQTRFIANPFGPGRLYKTGDLGRYRANGEIEFGGRIDTQVKLRGFRIELDEIEAVLAQHPAVQEAVVVVREDGNTTGAGEKKLVAYVVPAKETRRGGDKEPRRGGDKEIGTDDFSPSPLLPFSLADLRNYLQAKLPGYMVPSAFVLLESLPLTPNGKVDRKQLPAPNQPAPSIGQRLPQTETERQIAALWCKVLEIEQVGLDDNFFDVGGHSLHLVQVYQTLHNTWGDTLSLADLFQHPTIHQLATHLHQQKQKITPEPDKGDAQALRLRQAAQAQRRQLRLQEREKLA